MKLFCASVFIVLAAQGVYTTTLTERLSQGHVDVHSIGCKCMMTEPSTDNADTTLCMCFNREDGSLNKSDNCQTYTDTVFGFCSEATNTNNQWQTCVKHYCPCDAGMNNTIPKDQAYF